MKTTIKGLLVCGLLAFAVGLQAATPESQVYIRADAGLSLVNDTDLKNIESFVDGPGSATLKFDVGARVDLTAGYKISRDWAIEVETGITWNSVKELEFEAGPITGTQGVDADFYQIPFLASFVYTLPLESRFKPYLGAGGGGVFSIVSGNDMDDNNFGFAFQGLAGLDYELNANADFGVGYKLMCNFEPEFEDLELENVFTHSIVASITFRF